MFKCKDLTNENFSNRCQRLYGHQLALTLAQRGNEVNVLVKNPGSVNVPRHRGENISYADLFKPIRSLTGTKAKLILAPKYFAQTLAVLQWMQCKIISKQLFASAKTIHHQFCNKTFRNKKAINQLGYHLTPLNEGLLQTIQFLKPQNHA